MSVREKLIDLLHEAWAKAEEECGGGGSCCDCPANDVNDAKCMGALAVDYMIARGVTLVDDWSAETEEKDGTTD